MPGRWRRWATVRDGIGCATGRPGAQTVLVMGDGGLGIGGFDMETAARYNLPIVCVLYNNSSWDELRVDALLKDRTDHSTCCRISATTRRLPNGMPMASS